MNLILTRRLLPIFITQFLGAFNDNVYKNALVILITYKIAISSGENAQFLITIAAAVFILPFFIFSATAGQLADKYDRAMLTRKIKIAEIIIMLIGTIAFIIGNAWFLISILFITGLQSAFFGPIKYSILPQLLAKSELLTGNAYVEAGTFLAILLGTICGGILIIQKDGAALVSAILIIVAIIGYLASRYIPTVSPGDPTVKLNPNLLQATMSVLGFCAANKRVLYCVLSISWFWFVGATFLAQFPTLVKDYLHTEAELVTLFLALFTMGIAVGSFICTKIQRGKINSHLVPYAALGMSVFILDLFFACDNIIYKNVLGLLSIESFTRMATSWRIMLDIFLIAVFGGIYIVPLYTIVQHESSDIYRAQIIAANNVYNAMFMVISALFTIGMLMMGRTIPEVFFSIGILNILVVVAIFKLL